MKDCCRKTRPGYRCRVCGAPRWYDFRRRPTTTEPRIRAGIQPVRIPKALSRRHAPTLADDIRAIIKRNGPTAGWFIKD